MSIFSIIGPLSAAGSTPKECSGVVKRLVGRIVQSISHTSNQNLTDQEVTDPFSASNLNLRKLGNTFLLAETSLALNLALMKVISLLQEKYHIKFIGGNSSSAEISEILENPSIAILIAGIIGPFWEEVVFRLAPALTFGRGWKTGIVSAFIFAYMHNSHQLAVPQLIYGVFFWWLMKNRGINHSILAHMANNLTLVLMWHLSH